MKLIPLISTVALSSFSYHASGSVPELSALLPVKTQVAETVDFGVEPSLSPLMMKFQVALKSNPNLVNELRSGLKPGEMLPYDSRFGMSRDDYKKLMAGLSKMKLYPTGKTNLSISAEGGKIRIVSNATSSLRMGLVIDSQSKVLVIAGEGGQLRGEPFENRETPIAPNDGYSWHRAELNDATGEGDKVEVTISKLLAENKCLLSLDIAKVERGTLLRRETTFIRFDCR